MIAIHEHIRAHSILAHKCLIRIEAVGPGYLWAHMTCEPGIPRRENTQRGCQVSTTTLYQSFTLDHHEIYQNELQHEYG